MTSSFTKNVDVHSVYTFGVVLGTGAFGSVYSGTDKVSGERVAIKKLEISESDSDVLNETDIMHQLQSPFIIKFHGNYRWNKALFIVMELAKGDVSDLLKAHKSGLSEAFIAPICKCALGGLEFMHKLGFVHRDIKPENLLVTPDGRVKLSDFGVSSRRSRMHTLIGTPTNLAPEIVTGDEIGYTSKVDVWALGITLITIAEGKPPLSDVHPMRALFLISSAPPPKLKEPTKWSAPFRAVIDRTLVKDPAARFSAAQAGQLEFVVAAPVVLPSANTDAAHENDDDASDGSGDEAPPLQPLADHDKQEMAGWLQHQAQLESKHSGRNLVPVEALLVEAEETARKQRKTKKKKGKTPTGANRGSKHKKSTTTTTTTTAAAAVVPDPAVAIAPAAETAPVNSSLSASERAVADELALLRQSPAKYAEILAEARLGKYNAADNTLTLGNNVWDTKEGEKGALEAIEALRKLGDKPLPALTFADGLTRAAHAAIEADKNRPSAINALASFGSYSGAAQQSAVFGFDTARDIVIFLLIDDGQAKRSKRLALLDPALLQAGVAVAQHETFETMCLLLLVGGWTPKN
jgi:serine/threonine protein kinase